MNFFNRRRQQSPNQRVHEHRQDTPEQLEAKLRHLELTLKAKQLENWFNQRCVKVCCKFDNEFLDDNETGCLDNCNAKFARYLTSYKTANENFSKSSKH